MSSNLWLYSPARCDGGFCPKDCDHCEKGKEQDDLISRAAAIDVASGYCHPANIAQELAKLPPAQPDRSLWFRIGEICVDESKGFISSGRAVEKIRELLREAEGGKNEVDSRS